VPRVAGTAAGWAALIRTSGASDQGDKTRQSWADAGAVRL